MTVIFFFCYNLAGYWLITLFERLHAIAIDELEVLR